MLLLLSYVYKGNIAVAYISTKFDAGALMYLYICTVQQVRNVVHIYYERQGRCATSRENIPAVHFIPARISFSYGVLAIAFIRR